MNAPLTPAQLADLCVIPPPPYEKNMRLAGLQCEAIDAKDLQVGDFAYFSRAGIAELAEVIAPGTATIIDSFHSSRIGRKQEIKPHPVRVGPWLSPRGWTAYRIVDTDAQRLNIGRLGFTGQDGVSNRKLVGPAKPASPQPFVKPDEPKRDDTVVILIGFVVALLVIFWALGKQ